MQNQEKQEIVCRPMIADTLVLSFNRINEKTSGIKGSRNLLSAKYCVKRKDICKDAYYPKREICLDISYD